MCSDILNLKVTALTFGGDFIGTIAENNSDKDGMKMFLPFVVPGEKVKAHVTKEEKRLLRGSLLEIINASEARVSPPCKLFGSCGGCDLQHIEIEAQRKFKQEMVLSMLNMQAKAVPEKVFSTNNSLPSYNYRNRISLHLDKEGKLGFFKKNSGDVVDCDYCHISSERLNTALAKVRKYLNTLSECIGIIVIEESETAEYLVLKVREDAYFSSDILPEGLLSDFSCIEVSRDRQVLYSSISDAYPAGHFSQVNEYGNKELTKIVLENISGTNILDLYAGDGNFSIPLANSGKNVTAIEIDPKLTKYAEDKSLNKVEFVNLSCEKYLRDAEAFESIVLDPPRSGAKNILQYFNKEEIKEIVYISCSLPSLCRDLKEICGYGFKFKKLYFVDMFPQTYHVELVAVLKRT